MNSFTDQVDEYLEDREKRGNRERDIINYNKIIEGPWVRR